MIPRRLRRRQPLHIRRTVIKSLRPLTVEQVREIEARWTEATRRRPQVLSEPEPPVFINKKGWWIR